ncbi:MAG: Spy/CpxP family protein refolding chaperone [Gammaproteobacteria bacterium]
MNTTKSIALRAAALVGVLSALPLSGQAWGGGRGGPHGAGPGMMGMGPPPVMHVIRKLDLQGAQREQVFAILDRYQPSLRKLMFSLGDGRDALNGILVTGGLDATRVEQDATAQGQAAHDLYVTTARMLSEIGAVLTPEQRARLERGSDRAGPREPR